MAARTPRRSRRHVCAIARTDAARADLAVAWITEGLLRDEQVVWVEPDGGPLRGWLEHRAVDWRALEATGQLQTARPADVVRISSLADISARIDEATAKIRNALADGYSGLRMGGEVAEVLAVMPDVATQLRAEQAWEQLTLTDELSLMCVFDERLTDQHQAAGIAVHPREMTDGLVAAAVGGNAVHLSGELDVSNGSAVRAFLDVAAPYGGDVSLDSSGCSFIDVAGANALLSFARSRSPQRVRVTGAPPSLLRILEVTGGAELDLVPAA